MNADVVVLIMMFGVLSAGMALVLYGTITKTRWGINFDPLSCPRCNTPLPRLRDPQSTRQALWGGGTCAKCGTEFDKWGREVAAPLPGHLPGGGRSEEALRRLLKRRVIVSSAVAFFCLTLLFGWPATGTHPSTVTGWVVLAAIAAVETALFTALFYLALMYVLDRLGLGFRHRQD